MRTIKFRAWREDKKAMVYPDDKFHFIAMGKLFKLDPCLQENRYYEMPINIVIEQFTGLTDKNGKEIYEGDIARCCYPNDLQPYIGAVDYYTESACYALSGYEALLQHFDEITVIGNIHENPELL